MKRISVTAVALVFAALESHGAFLTNLHNFTFYDGASPTAGLVLSNHTLYGTTMLEGAYGVDGGGTVFQLDDNATGFTNIHNFTISSYDASINAYTNSDGSGPNAVLIVSGNTLFGTTGVSQV